MYIYDITVELYTSYNYMKEKKYLNYITVLEHNYDEQCGFAVADSYTSVRLTDCNKVEVLTNRERKYAIHEYITERDKIFDTIEKLKKQAIAETAGNSELDPNAGFKCVTDVEDLDGFEYNPTLNVY